MNTPIWSKNIPLNIHRFENEEADSLISWKIYFQLDIYEFCHLNIEMADKRFRKFQSISMGSYWCDQIFLALAHLNF